jgi:hypothetical protein
MAEFQAIFGLTLVPMQGGNIWKVVGLAVTTARHYGLSENLVSHCLWFILDLKPVLRKPDVSWLNFIFAVQPTLSLKRFFLLLQPWGKMSRILRILPSKNNSNGSLVEATVNLSQQNV